MRSEPGAGGGPESESMIERARRIVRGDVYPQVDAALLDWAEALLAEHAARVEAERERDDAMATTGHLRLARDDARASLRTAKARAEQAERERDAEARRADVNAIGQDRERRSWATQLAATKNERALRVAAEAHVAVLEAALNKHGAHMLDCDPEDDGECTCGLDALIGSFRAALGEQDTPAPRYDRATMWALSPDHFDEPAPEPVRCPSEHGVYRCQDSKGHAGAHWADVGRSPAVLRWGMVGYGCADPSCNRKPGHDLPHRDGKGVSWWPMDADETDPWHHSAEGER